MLTTEVTMKCDKTGCKKLVEGASRQIVKRAGRKAGWLVKGTKTQLCPDHRPAVTVKTKKAVAKKGSAKKVKSGTKVTAAKKGKTNATGKVWEFPTKPAPAETDPNA